LWQRHGGGVAWLYGGGGGGGYSNSSVPTGGTQSSGGTGGGSSLSYNGVAGTLGIGGDGGVEVSSNQAGYNIANPGVQVRLGGFQWHLGKSLYWIEWCRCSSYTGVLTNTSTTTGVETGNGLITLTYGFNGNGVSASPSQV